MSIELSRPNPFVSLEALGLIFGVHKDTASRMLRAQQLPCLTVGKLRKVPALALARHIENAGMADSGQGMALIRDAQRRSTTGNETLAVDITPLPIDRTPAIAKDIENREKNWARQDEIAAQASN